MQFNETKTMSRCPACGTITPKRDIREKKTQYCSRICQGLGKFSTRYRGSSSGPADRPTNIADKGKFQGNQ